MAERTDTSSGMDSDHEDSKIACFDARINSISKTIKALLGKVAELGTALKNKKEAPAAPNRDGAGAPTWLLHDRGACATTPNQFKRHGRAREARGQCGAYMAVCQLIGTQSHA